MNKEEKNQADDSQWETIEDAEFFKFAEIGDKIAGILIEKGVSKRYDFGLYTIMTKDGEQKRFHGSAQLDGLMLKIEVQDDIQIEYIDNRETQSGDMKIFDVKRKTTT